MDEMKKGKNQGIFGFEQTVQWWFYLWRWGRLGKEPSILLRGVELRAPFGPVNVFDAF